MVHLVGQDDTPLLIALAHHRGLSVGTLPTQGVFVLEPLGCELPPVGIPPLPLAAPTLLVLTGMQETPSM
jgi:hypothetical protein